MIIKSKTKEYEVTLSDNFEIVKELINLPDTYFVIDKIVYELYDMLLFHNLKQENLFIVEALEENKTIETALSLCEEMTKLSTKKNTHLISVGGGIIQDITGFVANILYRGIIWTFIPTTLLAACDSCIGGKTSLNYKKFKNLLGTFYPPDKIYICTGFFHSLSEKDYLSGLGEVIKFNCMSGQKGLDRIEKKIGCLLKRDEIILLQFVEFSLQFKKVYIEQDEFDRGIRIRLNFAHTFGHAFETVSHYVIPHGTAVALGMVAANHVSLSRGLLSEKLVERMDCLIRKIVQVPLLPYSFKIEDIYDAMRKDKKQTGTSTAMH